MTSPPTARFSICLIEDDIGRLLFLKRSASESIGAGQWGFPAGHIERGETPEQCAKREMREEIGSDHELVDVRYKGPVRDTMFGGKFEIHLFHFRWIAGSVTLNEEHTNFAWISAQEFDGYDAMLGIEQDIVLLGIWPAKIFRDDRIGVLPRE
ncbi:MAG: 8-oxo-dGTP pyrophosphatase MutT (NUDIX family) [Gammaproteobacteria bacterium]|jgi:8-oxo-dGTP pyrophosphatase MutT (NUDIX family)